MDQLTAHQKSQVDEFKALTGLLKEEKTEEVIKLLTINDWNLNNCAINYFDNGFESINESNHQQESNQQQESHDFERFDHENTSLHHRTGSSNMNLQSQMLLDDFLPRLPKAPRISNNWTFELGIHKSIKDSMTNEKQVFDEEKSKKKSPITSIWLFLLIIPKTLLQMIILFLKYFLGLGNTISTVNRFPNKFKYDNYEENYKMITNHEVENYNFFENDFNSVHERCQNNFEWLLVILVNDNKVTQAFHKNLLENPKFNKLFNKLNGVFKETCIYTNNIDKNPEAFEVGSTYKIKKLPYIMLIGNVTNNSSIMSSMSITYKSNISNNYLSDAKTTSDKILKNLNKLLENFNPQLITKRIDKQEIELSRIIKEQQDSAYLKSMEKDRLKKRQKEDEKLKQTELLNNQKTHDNFLIHLIQSNWFKFKNESLDGKTTKIAIKLPNGNRLIEIINLKINLIDLYFYVECKLFTIDLLNNESLELQNNDDALTYINNLQSEDDYKGIDFDEYLKKFPFNFELIQPFPKKIFEFSDTSIEHIPELKSGGNLLVEYTDNDD